VSDGWRAGLQDSAPALQVALGLVLLVSGFGKMRDRHSLVAGALRYRVLAPGVVRPAAALLPFVEMGLGAALLLGVSHRPTGWVAAALFAVFAVAVGINLRRGRAIPCHCFGASAADRIGPLSLARLLFLISWRCSLLVRPQAKGCARCCQVQLIARCRWPRLGCPQSGSP